MVKERSLATIELVLEEKIGLSAEMVGSEAIGSIVRRRMEECRISDSADYLAYLQTSHAEWDELVEAVVVPETWFFRNEESFTFLGQYVRTEWLPKNKSGLLRVMSAPCSTGEEPYSIAMTLLEAGLLPTRFVIDAVDISRKGLHKAQQGVYGPESFRRQDTFAFRERYFKATADGYRLDESIKNSVRFIWGNLLEDNFFSDAEPYNIIFCRNLLIYLSSSAKKKVIGVINRLLAATGILFVGHAERSLFQDPELVSITIPGVFAYHRVGRVDNGRLRQQNRKPQHFERRKSRPIHVLPEAPQPVAISAGISPKDEATNTELPVAVEHRKTPDEIIKTLDTARSLADQGDLKKALELCEHVLEQNAAHVQAYFLRGLIYQALNDYPRAEESFNKTIYLDPNHHEALYYLALIMEDHGERETADRLRQRIQRIHQRAVNNKESSMS